MGILRMSRYISQKTDEQKAMEEAIKELEKVKTKLLSRADKARKELLKLDGEGMGFENWKREEGEIEEAIKKYENALKACIKVRAKISKELLKGLSEVDRKELNDMKEELANQEIETKEVIKAGRVRLRQLKRLLKVYSDSSIDWEGEIEEKEEIQEEVEPQRIKESNKGGLFKRIVTFLKMLL